METILTQLAAMLRLPDGWDGYGGRTPTPAAVAAAAALVRFRAGGGCVVTPGRDGGVLVEWAGGEFDVGPDGELSFVETKG